MRRLWRRLCADPGSPPVLGAPRIEIYARLARATKQRASRRDWRNRTIRKGGEAAEIELTYSATGDISQAKPALGRLIVCIIQVSKAMCRFRTFFQRADRALCFDGSLPGDSIAGAGDVGDDSRIGSRF